MGVFGELFSWWNGQTLGTRLFTAQRGVRVGEDAEGNRYYEEKKPGPLGRKRRWVIYNGLAEASMVPPTWHGWLHHITNVPPTEEKVTVRPWEKPHRPNMTGTPQAYRPSGSILGAGRRPKATGDYKPWVPGN